jgi:putative transposase
LAHNFNLYQQGMKFMSGYDFDKYVNHELSKILPWIKECGSKARKQSIMNAETAFKRFFKGLGGKPRFNKNEIKTLECISQRTTKVTC